MAIKKSRVNRIAGLAWLVAAFLITLAVVNSRDDRQLESDGGTQVGQGVTLGSPIRPG